MSAKGPSVFVCETRKKKILGFFLTSCVLVYRKKGWWSARYISVYQVTQHKKKTNLTLFINMSNSQLRLAPLATVLCLWCMEDRNTCYGGPHTYYGGPHTCYGSPHTYYRGPHTYCGGPHTYYGGPHTYYGSPYTYYGGPHTYYGSPHTYYGGPQHLLRRSSHCLRHCAHRLQCLSDPENEPRFPG